MEIAFIVGGLVAIALGVWLRRRGAVERARRAAWPSTPGTIQSSRVTVEQSSGESGASTERFTVFYNYVVGGLPHTGSGVSDKRRDHRSLLAKYVAGLTADVFYDPADPKRSEIRDPLVQATGWAAGQARLGLVLILMGLIFAPVGVLMRFV